ncbi:MAG: hypothetical protein HY658_01880 [Actinobacteria bacterium]|nr:hypothetical protein [Actinomycetota bacterium]
MRRRTFDLLVSWVGVLLTVVLIVAGGFLFVGYRYADSTVTRELTAQKIFFPEAGSESLADPRIEPYLSKYAGQQLVTGAQAKAYANHYIAVHLEDIGGGLTYAEMGAVVRANPDDAELAGQRESLFKGETLRGLLLNAYAFWVFGQIALWATWGAFAAAILMAVLTVLGFIHGRRTPPEIEIGVSDGKRALVGLDA